MKSQAQEEKRANIRVVFGDAVVAGNSTRVMQLVQKLFIMRDDNQLEIVLALASFHNAVKGKGERGREYKSITI